MKPLMSLILAATLAIAACGQGRGIPAKPAEDGAKPKNASAKAASGDEWSMSRGGLLNRGKSSSKDVLQPKSAWTYVATARVSTEIVAWGDVIYFHDQASVVHAVRLEDGRRVWSSKTRAKKTADPKKRSKVIDEGDLTDLSAQQRVGQGCTFSHPVVTKDFVVSCTQAGVLTVYDRLTGEVKWQKEFAEEVYSTPRIWKNVLMVGCLDKKLHAFDLATGASKWVIKTGELVGATPAVTKSGTVYFMSYDGKLYKTKAKDGKVRETRVIGYNTNSHLCCAEACLFFPMSDQKLGCWSLTEDAFRWITPSRSTAHMQTPAYHKDKIYIQLRKQLCCFSSLDGKELWTRALSKKGATAVTIGEKFAYHHDGNNVSAYDLDTGKPAWTFPMKLTFAPVNLIKGRMLLAGTDGRIHCFQ